MRQILEITRALGDENRLRALMMLREGELCVCQIIELLGLAPSTVSRHMAILHDSGLVETRKEGRWIYYHLNEDFEVPCVGTVIAMARECLSKNDRIRDDARRLKGIRRMSRRELCVHYHN